MLTFLADATGITLGWQPDEPVFEATGLDDPDDDAGTVRNGEQPDLWSWQRSCEKIPEYMILIADGQAMVAWHRPTTGCCWPSRP